MPYSSPNNHKRRSPSPHEYQSDRHNPGQTEFLIIGHLSWHTALSLALNFHTQSYVPQ
ncbi:MAG: hypothetical protein F6K16_33290 [Symploca sp. SIO2B6]|nr:hypothetical protein [Symploca sp. SIO2B6]